MPSTDDEGICSTSPTASTTTMITAAASTSSSAAVDQQQQQHSSQDQYQQQQTQNEKNTATVSETQESNQTRGIEPMEIEADADHTGARREAKARVGLSFLRTGDILNSTLTV